jgi:Protein kinase domain
VFLRLGELLVAMGALDEAKVQEVLRLQGRHILVCSSCLSQYNVVGYVEGQNILCRRCQEPLERPQAVAKLSVEETLSLTDLAVGEGEPEFGGYNILGEISRGGMGIIYKARQRSLDRVVAMKVMSSMGGDEEGHAFMREARAVARLRHPHIVAIHEVGTIGEVDYFTMDYIEGLPLDRAIATEGLTQREIVEIFAKMCDAVDYAHKAGILHRDLKPSNVLLDKKHSPVIIDFGISRATEAEDSHNDEIIGSPAYLPPEYLTGKGSYKIPGEIYALGATLYTCLSGRQPHSGLDTIQVLKKARSEDVTPIRKLTRGVDRDLASIVMTTVARDPEDRYQSAKDVGDDLRRWLEGEDITGGSRWVRWWNRIRGQVAATLGLLITLVFLVTTTYDSMEMKALRKDAERAEQLERERDSAERSLVESRLELAVALIESERPAEAEQLLSRLLDGDPKGFVIEIYKARYRARIALEDRAGAEKDAEAVRKLGGKLDP